MKRAKQRMARRGTRNVQVQQPQCASSCLRTFEAFSNCYLEARKPLLSRESYTREERIISSLLAPFFGKETHVSEIRRADIVRYVGQRQAAVSAGSVTKELNIIKRMLSFAVERELIPGNPAYGVKAPRVHMGRARTIQATELREILRFCPEWLKPIVLFAVATGMTRGEIVKLVWRDVKQNNRQVAITSRNGQRVVPLNKLARKALASVRRNGRQSTHNVFSGDSVTPINISQAFRRACVAAGTSTTFSFNDLRNTAAKWMWMAGAPPRTVAELLGQKDPRTLAKYSQAIDSNPSLEDAIKLIDRAFIESMTYSSITAPSSRS